MFSIKFNVFAKWINDQNIRIAPTEAVENISIGFSSMIADMPPRSPKIKKDKGESIIG